MSEPTLYRIDNLDSASRITAKNWLIDEGVLVPVEPGLVRQLIFDIVMTERGLDESDGDDQQYASEATDAWMMQWAERAGIGGDT